MKLLLRLPGRFTAGPTAGFTDQAQTEGIPSDYGEYTPSAKERLLFCTAGGCFLAGTFYLFYRSLLISLAAGLFGRAVLPLYEAYMAEKRRRELNAQFRDLLGSLSSSIAAGRQMENALLEAVSTLSAIYPEDAPIMRELRHMERGICENHESDRDLLSNLAVRSRSEDIISFVQVYLTCRNTGGDLGKVISHTSQILSDKMEISEQIHAITAQRKFEGRLICLMPVVMLLALNLLSRTYIDVLYSCLAGRLIMTLCLAGIAAGAVLMERISDVRV